MAAEAPHHPHVRRVGHPVIWGRPARIAGRVLLRIGWMLVVVWAAVSLTFLLSRVMPADPARLAAGLQAGPEQVAEVRSLLGLDRPLLTQYFDYMSGIVTLDFGDSIQTRGPVLGDVLYALPATLELVIAAFVVYATLGIALGVVWALRPRGLAGRMIGFVTIVGIAIPVFWIGLVLQVFLGAGLEWFPISGQMSYADWGIAEVTGFSTLDAALAGNLPALGNALWHLVLPVTALVASQLAVATRLMRTSMDRQLRRPYVRVARARGTSEPRLVVVDVLRNALNPVVTMLALQFGWLLAGTILIEVVFSWPGLGLYAFNAFRTFDYNPILAITIIVTVTFVVVNELVGLLYPALDPRLRDQR